MTDVDAGRVDLPAEWRAALGSRLRLARRKAGLSYVVVGERCGVAEATVRHACDGDTMPRIDTLARIAAALGVTVGWLIGESCSKAP